MKKKISNRVHPGVLYATIAFLCTSLVFFSCKKMTENTVGLAPTTDTGISFSAAALTYNYTNLFNGGDGAYHRYRIPSLIRTTKGTMLAICEGRKNSSADYGDIDVVCRRLLSGASGWETTQRIIAGGTAGDTDTWGNPTVVVNQVDGKIWLFMS